MNKFEKLNSILLKDKIKLNFKEYLKRFSDIPIKFDQVEYLLSLCRKKYEFCVDQKTILKYLPDGINIKDLVEDMDYEKRDNIIYIQPYSFKFFLMESENTDYKNYYIFIEECLYYFNEYIQNQF